MSKRAFLFQRVTTTAFSDVSTAYHSTGIPNVTVYMDFPSAMVSMMRLTRFLGPLIYTRTTRDFIKRIIGKFFAPGPSRTK
jgi:short subunit dehydrogenase-like uncharacterized protein